MIPRVKTFSWRFLRYALTTGDRASEFSSHIEKLFCRRKTSPQHVPINTFGLLNGLETEQLIQPKETSKNSPGISVPTDFYFTGPKLYVDAAWRRQPRTSVATSGVGKYYAESFQDGGRNDVFIMASKKEVPSPLHAKAHVMVLAAHFAAAMKITKPTFFTDNLNFAKVAIAPGVEDHNMIWEIRRQAIQF